VKVLGIAGSARRQGNTRLLLDAFLDEAAKNGRKIETVVPAGLRINPCLGCDKCLSGECIQKDTMQELYPKLKSADVIVLAAPVYFYGLPSAVKALIDRCQLFFNQTYRKKVALREKPGKGAFISCGATKGQRLFDGAILTVKYWFDTLGVEYSGEALFRGVDEAGAILQHAEALEEVRGLAQRLIRP